MAKAAPVEPRDIEISQKLSVGGASLLMAAMIGLSRLTGFGRMMLVAHLYGTGPQTRVFEAAFNIPDTITILIAGGALATGFVPVFTEYLVAGDQDGAKRTFRAIWTLLGAAFGIVTAVLFALTFTPWGHSLAPEVQPQYLPLYFQVLRILLIAQFFFVVGGLFSGTLNALRLFIYPALQPVMFNLGIIIFGIVLPVFFGMDISAQAWGALVGAIVGSLLIQMPAVLKHGLSLSPLWDLKNPGVHRVLKSLLPIVFGLASGQIIALNLPRFVAYHAVSQLPAIGYTNRLMQVPLDLLASGPAIALFPTLALLYAQRNYTTLRDELASALRRTIVLTVLATALLAALRFPIIHFLLEHGDFKKTDTKAVAPVLGCYAFCIVGLGAQQVLARGFYAMNQYVEPIIIGRVAMGIFTGLAELVLLQDHGSAAGLASAAAVAVTILGGLMFISLKRKLRSWDKGATNRTFARSIVAGVVSYYATLYVAKYCFAVAIARHLDVAKTETVLKFLTRGAVVGIAATAGTLAFVLAGWVLGLRELDVLIARFKRKRTYFVSTNSQLK